MVYHQGVVEVGFVMNKGTVKSPVSAEDNIK